jgi:hypothetical protein
MLARKFLEKWVVLPTGCEAPEEISGQGRLLAFSHDVLKQFRHW